MKHLQPIVQLSQTAHLLRDQVRAGLAMGFVCLAEYIRLQAALAIQIAGDMDQLGFAGILNSPQGNGIGIADLHLHRSGGCRFSLAAPT